MASVSTLTQSMPRPGDEDQKQLSNTIYALQYDPRVRRGPVLAQTVILDEELMHTQQRKRLTKLSQAGLEKTAKNVRPENLRPIQPSIAELHDSIVVEKPVRPFDFDKYLVDHNESVPTETIATQTDSFLPEKAAEPYRPRKRGADVQTQVDSSHIFDYDAAIEPMVDVLISKTLEQALVEVREDTELEIIHQEKQRLREKLRAELAAEEQRVQQDKHAYTVRTAKIAAAQHSHQRIEKLRRKLAAGYYASKYLSLLVEDALSSLELDGAFVAEQRDNTIDMFELLVPAVDAAHDAARQAQNQVNEFVSRAVEATAREAAAIADARSKRLEAERQAMQEAARIRSIEEAKSKRVALYLHTTLFEQPVGPLRLTAGSSLTQLHTAIMTWLQENMDDPPSKEHVSLVIDGLKISQEDTRSIFDLGLTSSNRIELAIEPAMQITLSTENDASDDDESSNADQQTEDLDLDT